MNPLMQGLLVAVMALIALLPTGAQASAQTPTPPTPAELELAGAGHWVGELVYRDYRSQQMQRLPMHTRVSVADDRATVTRLATFDDGPTTGAVLITTVSLYDSSGSRVSSATFRKGRAVELLTEEVTVSSWQDPTHWTRVHLHRGSDNNAAADIRVTHTRRGPVITAVKEVKPPDQPDSSYAFRNRSVLTLQEP